MNMGRRAGVLAAFLTLWELAKFLMVLTLAYLLWYLWRKDMAAILTEATSRFGRELLRAFIFAVIVPAAIVVSFLTIIGAMAGIVAALVYAAIIILATPVTILVASSFLMKRKSDLRWYHILFGAVVLEIVMFIPFIGWIAYLLVYLASLGALLNVLRRRFIA
jgi:hypothetical protein